MGRQIDIERQTDRFMENRAKTLPVESRSICMHGPPP